MDKKDRQWKVTPNFAIEVCASDGDPIGHALFDDDAWLVVKTHNAAIEALEAENARLRAVVEAVIRHSMPVTRYHVDYLRDVAWTIEGLEEGDQDWIFAMVDALEPLVEEGGDD